MLTSAFLGVVCSDIHQNEHSHLKSPHITRQLPLWQSTDSTEGCLGICRPRKASRHLSVNTDLSQRKIQNDKLLDTAPAVVCICQLICVRGRGHAMPCWCSYFFYFILFMSLRQGFKNDKLNYNAFIASVGPVPSRQGSLCCAPGGSSSFRQTSLEKIP